MYKEEDAPVESVNGKYGDGMYEVGKDIPAGKYIIYPSEIGSPAYHEIDSDLIGSIDSIISNDLFTGRSQRRSILIN